MKIFIPLLILISSFMTFANSNNNFDLKNAKYEKLQNSSFIQEEPKEKNVEILYFFSYGCHFCYDFENYKETFLRSISLKNISFINLPISPIPAWEQYAKAYYIADALGLDIHKDILIKVHIKNQKILTKEQLENYFVNEKKVSIQNFKRAYNSMSINFKLKENEEIADKYNITGTPSIVVIFKDGTTLKLSPKISDGFKNTIVSLITVLLNYPNDFI